MEHFEYAVTLLGIDHVVTVLCYNWFGDGLRDAIDPTLAER